MTYQIMISIYETRLFVCFLLFIVMRSTKLGSFRSHSWTLWKALENKGSMMFGLSGLCMIIDVIFWVHLNNKFQKLK